MARKPKTSKAEILDLLGKGFTREEIMELKGISNSGITYHLRYAGAPVKGLAERVKDMLPWEITGEPVSAAPYRRLRWHLEYQETRGVGMSKEKLQKLRGFYEKLDEFGLVVRYDPDIPPTPWQKFGAFEYAAREPSDGDSILRFDKHTEVAGESRDRWRLPARADWPE